MILAEIPKSTPLPIVAVANERAWLDHYLSNWASWMRSKKGAVPDVCPTEASGGLTPYSNWGTDLEGMYERMDAEHAETVHVIIWRLSDAERNAMYFEYGLIRELELFRFDVVLEKARDNVLRGMKRAGLWFGS